MGKNIDTDLCAALAGQHLLLIGSEETYILHDHLLRLREQAEGRGHPCPGTAFCTHHRICGPSGEQVWNSKSTKDRSVKSPTTEELERTGDALVTFVLSSGLGIYPTGEAPLVDPATGIRIREAYPPWNVAARRVKSGIIVLSKGINSAPAWSYEGNWTFLDQLPSYVLARGDRDPNRGGAYAYGRNSGHSADVVGLQIVNAAVHMTVTRFLPEVVGALEEVTPTRRRKVVWAGNWFRTPVRWKEVRFREILAKYRSLMDLHIKSGERNDLLAQLVHHMRFESESDPWGLYHDVQGMNAILMHVRNH
ncbi:hypothetical protein BJ138DRAFT_1158963 [Hygrophoropsis aurantiaca]|uniref:Uncharacterized protein n=1 Tax=Hygrophoropsis aurantiaca TaxID=72124 RepID=A0ACB8A352_9AGAM|nr:hypothetical protein BJ138DRAFT_1158963 [Hygrophoropsis aurantiaca]